MQPYGPFRHIKNADLYPYLTQPLPTGVLKHEYVDASDDTAAWKADQCDRQAVTAKWAWDNLCDIDIYLYVETNVFDPWLIIDGGMDKIMHSEEFILCFGRTGEVVVAPDHRVFVSKRIVQRVLEGK